MTSFARSARKDATTPRSKLGFEILVPYPVSNPHGGTAVSTIDVADPHWLVYASKINYYFSNAGFCNAK